MTLRRVFVGTAVVFGLSVWAWCRAGEEHPRVQPADPVRAAEAGPVGGGTYDDAAHRYRTGQSRHWRQVMIGTH
jgi:hypothetical protein